MVSSASLFPANTLLSGMMRYLIFGLSFAFISGCDSYTVELNPNWEEDSSQTSISDPSAADPSSVDPSSEDPSVEETTTEDPTDT